LRLVIGDSQSRIQFGSATKSLSSNVDFEFIIRATAFGFLPFPLEGD